jgi:hypothetical protein
MVIRKNVGEARQTPSRGREINWILWISVLLSVLALFALVGVFSVRTDEGPGIVTPGPEAPAR